VLRSGGRLVIVRIRGAVVDVVRVHSLLVGSPLVLDHGCFAAKAEVELVRDGFNGSVAAYLLEHPS